MPPAAARALTDPAALGEDVDRIFLNPDVLTFPIGDRDGDSLRESAMGAVAEDPEAGDDVDASGGLATNPVTGAAVEMRNPYGTDGRG